MTVLFLGGPAALWTTFAVEALWEFESGYHHAALKTSPSTLAVLLVVCVGMVTCFVIALRAAVRRRARWVPGAWIVGLGRFLAGLPHGRWMRGRSPHVENIVTVLGYAA